MKRMGMVIRLKTDKIQEYKRLHADVWPDVLKTIAKANIKYYTIFLREPENLLLDIGNIMELILKLILQKSLLIQEHRNGGKSPISLQIRMESSKANEQWSIMEEVFHTD